jgi:hypothetical protein
MMVAQMRKRRRMRRRSAARLSITDNTEELEFSSEG